MGLTVSTSTNVLHGSTTVVQIQSAPTLPVVSSVPARTTTTVMATLALKTSASHSKTVHVSKTLNASPRTTNLFTASVLTVTRVTATASASILTNVPLT